MNAEGTRLIGHRGFAAEFPENSIPAIRQAPKYADAVEIDVRRCGSGEFVAVHDDTVGPFGRRRPVADCSLEAIRRFNDHVPTIEDMLTATPPDYPLILEIKDPEIAIDLAGIAADATQPIQLSAANPSALASLQHVDEELNTALVHIPSIAWRAAWPFVSRAPRFIRRGINVEELIDRAIQFDCNEIHCRFELCLSTDVVDRARERGLGVAAWTVRSSPLYEKLVEIGVDGIFVDTWRVDPRN